LQRSQLSPVLVPARTPAAGIRGVDHLIDVKLAELAGQLRAQVSACGDGEGLAADHLPGVIELNLEPEATKINWGIG
jgi:hypothetical protein